MQKVEQYSAQTYEIWPLLAITYHALGNIRVIAILQVNDEVGSLRAGAKSEQLSLRSLRQGI